MINTNSLKGNRTGKSSEQRKKPEVIDDNLRHRNIKFYENLLTA